MRKLVATVVVSFSITLGGAEAGAAEILPSSTCSYSFVQDTPEDANLNARGRVDVFIGGVSVASYRNSVTWQQFIDRPPALAAALAEFCNALGGK